MNNQSLLGEETKSAQNTYKTHSNKTIADLEVIKKQLKKEAFNVGADPNKKKLFHECCKAISDLKKRKKAKEDKKNG